eukprot:m.122911 g.122911  ORF g.122911 m.122911 type:complete len:52 (+) comp37805_c0_seq8:1529-1684(+)
MVSKMQQSKLKQTGNFNILDVLPGNESKTEDQGQQLFKFRREIRKTVDPSD